MLAKVVVHTVTCTVIGIKSLLGMFSGDYIDNASHCIAAIEGTLRSLYDFYTLDVLRIYQAKVVLSSHIAMKSLAVHKHQNIGIAKTVQLHLRTHIALGKGKRGRK